MRELKPCPFCGGEAAIEEYNDGSGGVYCTVCRFEPLTHASYRCQEDKPKAIKEWNARTPDIDIPADRLQEICEAEKDGRLVVLPCKAGETVYVPKDRYKGKRLAYTDIISGIIDHFTIGEAGVPVADISTEDDWLIACGHKEYSLTKEAAEAALLKGDE